ncbi:hypothetical protein HHI36_008357 [Cryptolaemus montrouzieri]|uniref:Protein PET117 homolog, mitochondrial n=1 Tax=Cryptolaemus montrouzieri TaxID=559131 RepID=A0ABD2MS49_9CUCU
MSVLAKVIFGSSCVFAVSVIGYVHYRQAADRERMFEGVLRDIDRQQKRKIENLFILQKQQELTKQLKKEENDFNNRLT